MRRCYYSLIQFVPDAMREEGRNVGLIVVREPDDVLVQTLTSREDMYAVCRSFGVYEWTLTRTLYLQHFQRRLEALATRIRTTLNDATAKGIIHFEAQEASDLWIMPPHAVASAEPQEIMDRLFPRLVDPKGRKIPQ